MSQALIDRLFSNPDGKTWAQLASSRGFRFYYRQTKLYACRQLRKKLRTLFRAILRSLRWKP